MAIYSVIVGNNMVSGPSTRAQHQGVAQPLRDPQQKRSISSMEDARRLLEDALKLVLALREEALDCDPTEWEQDTHLIDYSPYIWDQGYDL